MALQPVVAVVAETLRPCPWSVEVAEAWLMPITFWTTTWHDPLETVRLIAVPGLTCWPPDGLEAVTIPLA